MSTSANAQQDSQACYNCETPMGSSDAFCAACGQKRQQLRITLFQLLGQWWEATLDIDNKFWRTLWTLFRSPGKLTEEFFKGRRVRYLRPVTLCLLATGASFLSLQWTTARSTPIGEIPAGSDGVVQVDVLPGFRVGLPQAYFDQSDAPLEERLAIIEGFVNRKFNSSERYWVPRILAYVSDDGVGRLQDRLIEIGSRAAFALIPMFAIVVFVLHFRSATYVESVIYALHVHSCAFLLAAAGCVLPIAAQSFVAPVLAIFLLWHVYRSLRVAFGNRILSAICKTVVLLCSELIFALTAVCAVVYFILVVFHK